MPHCRPYALIRFSALLLFISLFTLFSFIFFFCLFAFTFRGHRLITPIYRPFHFLTMRLFLYFHISLYIEPGLRRHFIFAALMRAAPFFIFFFFFSFWVNILAASASLSCTRQYRYWFSLYFSIWCFNIYKMLFFWCHLYRDYIFSEIFSD